MYASCPMTLIQQLVGSMTHAFKVSHPWEGYSHKKITTQKVINRFLTSTHKYINRQFTHSTPENFN